MSLPCPNLHNWVYGHEDLENHFVKWVNLDQVYPGSIPMKFTVTRQSNSHWKNKLIFVRHRRDFLKKILSSWPLCKTTDFLPSHTMAIQFFLHGALVRLLQVFHANFCGNRPTKSGEIKIFVQRQNYVNTPKEDVPHVSHQINRLLLYTHWWFIFFFSS